MNREADRCKRVYLEAEAFLPTLGISGVTPALIKKYQSPANLQPRPKSIPDIYRRLCISAQNANMKAGVIGGSIGGIQKLEKVFFNFDPAQMLSEYGHDWARLLDRVVSDVNPRGKVRRTPRGIWPQYCKSVLSSASFLVQFKSSVDFFAWVDFFNQDDRARASLPLLLSREIEGFGFALACDFLKEMGFVNFPKPDVHLRKIFGAIGLCEKPKNDYYLFKSIIYLSSCAKVSPYNADKTFWLIGSGYFYDDRHIGKRGRIGSHRDAFIKHIKAINI